MAHSPTLRLPALLAATIALTLAISGCSSTLGPTATLADAGQITATHTWPAGTASSPREPSSPAVPGAPDPDSAAGTLSPSGSGTEPTAPPRTSSPGVTSAVTSTSTLPTAPPTTDSRTPSVTVTYQMSTTTGPVTSVTTNGAVYVLPEQPTITLAPSQIITVTTPPGLNSADVDIDGATHAYVELWKLADRAFAEPTGEWIQQFRAVAMDQLAKSMADDVASRKAGSQRNVGHSTIAIVAVKASAGAVDFRACVDTSGVDVVNSNGVSVRSDIGDADSMKFTQTAHVVLSAGMWKVESVGADGGASC